MLQTKKSQAGTVAVLQDQSVWLVLQSQRDVHSYILKLHFTNYICGNVWRSIKQDKTLKEWNVSFVVLSIWPHCPWAGCPRTVHVDSFLSFLFCVFFSPNTVFQEWPGFFFFFFPSMPMPCGSGFTTPVTTCHFLPSAEWSWFGISSSKPFQWEKSQISL